ncbi:MAG: metal ABC transporter ATP-binding protein [Clostridia bacterium]|nr:metal ABC transporter ATP-binding protein [Clostridia bacterium]
MALIECKNVCLSYDNVVVAEDLSFSVNEGDFLCIVGENGSGKSTLVKAILGLKSVSSGSIDFSKELSDGGIGYLPQQTTTQKDFPASVFEVVLSGCLKEKKNRIFFSKKEKQIACENMKKLDILGFKNKCYRELSGGQQQRVLLARALCSANKLLLLDEPVSGLDVVVTAEFYSLIEKLNREYSMTVIMVSHDILYAASHASHILHLKKNGSYFSKAEEYTASDIFNSFKDGVGND